MTQCNQVPCRVQARLDVGDHHGMRELAGMLVVEQNDGHLHVREQRHVLGAHAGRGDDDAVHAPLFELARHADFALRFRIGIGQEDRQAVLVRQSPRCR